MSLAETIKNLFGRKPFFLQETTSSPPGESFVSILTTTGTFFESKIQLEKAQGGD